MTENTEAQTPAPHEPATAPAVQPAPESLRLGSRWKGLAGALVVGVVVGGGIGAGTVALLADPTASEEYQSLETELRAAEGSGSTERTSAAPSSSAAATSSPASGEPDVGEVGQIVSNRGVTLTVTGARVVDSIALNKSSYQAGSGYETWTPTAPDPGGKFVVVETHIVNNAMVSMDLTCSYPIRNVLVDTRDRQFDSIDSLHELRGNPECNYQLQPGFESDMTYVYLVPADAQIKGWAFSDATEMDGQNDWTAVRLTV